MKRGIYPRDVLNRLKWEKGLSLAETEIVILHRGAPDNRRTIVGSEIIRIGPLFFETAETAIPYHRIIEIKHKGKILFNKKPREK